MNWTTPRTDWEDSDLVSTTDFDRIERNIEYLRVLLG